MDSIPAPGPHHEHKPHKSMVLGSHLEFRDEQIYLRSIAPHVHLSRSPGNEKGGEVVNIQWGRVLWITTKDHVLTPLIRGLVWCVPKRCWQFPFPFYSTSLQGNRRSIRWPHHGSRHGEEFSITAAQEAERRGSWCQLVEEDVIRIHVRDKSQCCITE